jgi:hypothetical protein
MASLSPGTLLIEQAYWGGGESLFLTKAANWPRSPLPRLSLAFAIVGRRRPDRAYPGEALARTVDLRNPDFGASGI